MVLENGRGHSPDTKKAVLCGVATKDSCVSLCREGRFRFFPVVFRCFSSLNLACSVHHPCACMPLFELASVCQHHTCSS